MVPQTSQVSTCPPSSRDCRPFRSQGRKAARDQIGVDEVQDTRILWQKLPGEGGLARAVRTGDDNAKRRPGGGLGHDAISSSGISFESAIALPSMKLRFMG